MSQFDPFHKSWQYTAERNEVECGRVEKLKEEKEWTDEVWVYESKWNEIEKFQQKLNKYLRDTYLMFL